MTHRAFDCGMGAIAIQQRTSKHAVSSMQRAQNGDVGGPIPESTQNAFCEAAKIAKISKIAKPLRRPSRAE